MPGKANFSNLWPKFLPVNMALIERVYAKKDGSWSHISDAVKIFLT